MTAEPGARPPLDLARLRERTSYDVEVVEQAGSTNALVAERVAAGAAEGLLVAAEHQTAGRGRLDRAWETPARAALTFSVLLRPHATAPEWTWLPLLAGVAVAGALREAGLQVDLKWPNDVLVGGRKVAGILVERVESPEGAAAVVGVGINVSTTAEELPVETATSMALAGVEADRTDLLVRVLDHLRREYDAWLRPGGIETLRAAYVGLCPTVRGAAVHVLLPGGEELDGVGDGLTDAGALVVRTGTEHVTVSAGDVIHVKPGRE